MNKCIDCKNIIGRRAVRCVSCANRKRALENNPMHKKTMREYFQQKYGKLWKQKWDDLNKQRSETAKANKVNVGSKNGMKQLEARKKVSDWRKNMPEQLRRQISERTAQAWKDGKFDGVKVGRCKWYTINTKGGLIKVQGKWELMYALYLIDNGIRFYSHRGRISYIDGDGNSRSYYPDFYLVDEDKYVDIKADYFWELQKEKFQYIKEQNECQVEILLKKDLLKMGVFKYDSEISNYEN